MLRLFLMLAQSDDELYADSNDVFLPVSNWHDNSYFHGSFDDVTYLPTESWIRNSNYFPPESSVSGTLTSANSQDSLLWNHEMKPFPPPQTSYDLDGISQGELGPRLENQGLISSSGGYGMRPPGLIGVDNSFAIDPEFSFLHGLSMPLDPSIFLEQEEAHIRNTKHHPSTSSSSNDFSESTVEPKSDPSSNSDEGASSGSKSSGQSLDPFLVLPEIGSDIMKSKQEAEKKIKLDQFDVKLKEHIVNQLNKLQKDPENWLKNLPGPEKQWENDHNVLPSINNSQTKPPLRRCANSEGSLRPRLGSELPTIWEDASSPNQVIFVHRIPCLHALLYSYY